MARNEESKKGFVIYASVFEALEGASDAEFRECILKMKDYAFDGTKANGSTFGVNATLMMAYPTIEAAQKRHLIAVSNGNKGKDFGKDGGAPIGNQNARKHPQNPKTTPKQPLDIDIDKDVDNEKDIYSDKNNYVEKDNQVKENTAADGQNSVEAMENASSISRQGIEELYSVPTDFNHQPKGRVSFKTITLGDAWDGETVEMLDFSNEPITENGTDTKNTASTSGTKVVDLYQDMQDSLTRDLDVLIDIDNGTHYKDDRVFKRAVDEYMYLFNETDYKKACKAVGQLKYARKTGDLSKLGS